MPLFVLTQTLSRDKTASMQVSSSYLARIHTSKRRKEEEGEGEKKKKKKKAFKKAFEFQFLARPERPLQNLFGVSIKRIAGVSNLSIKL